MSEPVQKRKVPAKKPIQKNHTNLFWFLALPFGFQFLAGAIAGVSEILVMYPLDGKIPPPFFHPKKNLPFLLKKSGV